MALERVTLKLLQRYWRLTRSLTLGAQGIVRDERGHVLLIRHTYRPGWHFPGGGVERGEAAEAALERELFEEAGVAPTEPVRLLGLYTNFERFPGDHIALFLVPSWRHARVPEPNREIAEHGFFAPDTLPPTTTLGTRRRLAELLGQTKPDRRW